MRGRVLKHRNEARAWVDSRVSSAGTPALDVVPRSLMIFAKEPSTRKALVRDVQKVYRVQEGCRGRWWSLGRKRQAAGGSPNFSPTAVTTRAIVSRRSRPLRKCLSIHLLHSPAPHNALPLLPYLPQVHSQFISNAQLEKGTGIRTPFIIFNIRCVATCARRTFGIPLARPSHAHAAGGFKAQPLGNFPMRSRPISPLGRPQPQSAAPSMRPCGLCLNCHMRKSHIFSAFYVLGAVWVSSTGPLARKLER